MIFQLEKKTENIDSESLHLPHDAELTNCEVPHVSTFGIHPRNMSPTANKIKKISSQFGSYLVEKYRVLIIL